MWILVMTVLGIGGSNTIARFTSNQACVDAGNDWAKRVNMTSKQYGYAQLAINKCYKE